MVLDFTKSLDTALQEIEFQEDFAEFFVFDASASAQLEGIDARFSKALWTIVEILNTRYKSKLEKEFNLYHWIEHNPSDEVAYFLNESSSNCMNYSEYKAVWKFLVYFGSKGFVLATMQQGKGFNAVETHEKKLKSNEGAGFLFYDGCSSVVFFDDAKDAREVYFQYLIR